MSEKELITAQALADALDLSVETIWRYTREKKIPFVELGSKQYRYRLDDVIKALSAPRVKEKEARYDEINPARKYTYHDYLELPEKPGYRYEILDGMLIREPSPNVIHQRVSRRLQRLLEEYFWQTDPGGEVFDAPLDVTFGDVTVVQPDIFYVSAQQKSIIEENRIDGPPALIVEIVSPSTRRKDRLQKMDIYRRAGVEHYWLVNPDEKTLECFWLKDGLYSLVAGGMDDDTVEHPAFSGLKIPLGTLWQE